MNRANRKIFSTIATVALIEIGRWRTPRIRPDKRLGQANGSAKRGSGNLDTGRHSGTNLPSTNVLATMHNANEQTTELSWSPLPVSAAELEFNLGWVSPRDRLQALRRGPWRPEFSPIWSIAAKTIESLGPAGRWLPPASSGAAERGDFMMSSSV